MILAIESSCDESALALFDPDKGVEGEWVHSQIDLHQDYGGVVPVQTMKSKCGCQGSCADNASCLPTMRTFEANYIQTSFGCSVLQSMFCLRRSFFFTCLNQFCVLGFLRRPRFLELTSVSSVFCLLLSAFHIFSLLVFLLLLDLNVYIKIF